MCTVSSHPAPSLHSVTVLKTSFCNLQAYYVLGDSPSVVEDTGVKQSHSINRSMGYFCLKRAEMIVVGLLVSQHFMESEPVA